MQLKGATLNRRLRPRKPTEANVGIDEAAAKDIAQALELLIKTQKNGIALDSYEKLIWDVISKEIVSGNEKEQAKEILRLRAENEKLNAVNNAIRERNKELTLKLG